jgi:hypothetical protein
MLTVTETEKGVVFEIHVVPRSSKCELTGLQGNALKIKITASPVEGRANDACIHFLASLFNVKKARVAIESGQKSKNKRVSIAGLTSEDVRAALPRDIGQKA